MYVQTTSNERHRNKAVLTLCAERISMYLEINVAVLSAEGIQMSDESFLCFGKLLVAHRTFSLGHRTAVEPQSFQFLIAYCSS